MLTPTVQEPERWSTGGGWGVRGRGIHSLSTPRILQTKGVFECQFNFILHIIVVFLPFFI